MRLRCILLDAVPTPRAIVAPSRYGSRLLECSVARTKVGLLRNKQAYAETAGAT